MAPQLDQVSERRPRAVSNLLCFFFFFFFPALCLLGLLFGDASVLTLEVRGHSSTGAILLLLPNALSLWFTTHAGPCHSAPTQPSFTRMWIRRASLAGRRILSSLSGRSSQSPVYLKITALDKTSSSVWAQRRRAGDVVLSVAPCKMKALQVFFWFNGVMKMVAVAANVFAFALSSWNT